MKNGKVVVPGGVEYELLVLPNTNTMSEKMLKRIGELVDAGARVVAQRRPVRAPGLGRAVAPRPPSDGTGCRPYRALVDSVWAKGVMECSVADALAKLGVKPDFLTDAEDVTWIHRAGRARSPSAPGGMRAARWSAPTDAPSHVDWYFVAQDNEIDSTFEASFRVTGRTPEIWDAITGERRPAEVWREENGRTYVTFNFKPSGSAFVVFREKSAGTHLVKAEVVPMAEKKAEVPKPRHTLVIKKAEYGLFPGMEVPPGGITDKHRINVTRLLADRVKDGTINVDVGVGLARRDPAFRFHKITRIEYEYDGVTYKVDRGEGARFRVPDNAAHQEPEWEWRDGKVLAWKPLTAKLSDSDGAVRTVSANPAGAIEVTGVWDVTFPQGWDAPAQAVFPKLVSWSESRDAGIKYFSGTATYRKSVKCKMESVKCEQGGRVMLDLGEVKNFAEVTVNGKKFPVLWKPPFRVDITDAVKTASVQQQDVLDLEIRVTNLWPNRLIGDEVLCKPDREWVAHPRRGSFEYSIKEIPQWVKDGKSSPTGRRTFTTWRHWTKDDKPLPSGLIGPVVIRFGEKAK